MAFRNKISDEGAKYITDQIKMFPSLSSLKIFFSGNQSTQNGHDALLSLKEIKKIKVEVYI